EDLASAAAADLDGAVAAIGGAAPGLGIAAFNPESADVQAVLRALARRYAGPFLHAGAVASGTAAAVAEAWIGAARDVRDVIFFAIAEHASAGILRDGSPLAGAHRRAPAVGWLALNPVEREDYRKSGCLEAEVAAPGIVRRLPPAMMQALTIAPAALGAEGAAIGAAKLAAPALQ